MRTLMLLRMMVAGAWAQDRLRAFLALAAIALGVALGFAVQLINGTAVNELAQGVHALSGDADLQVRGARSGFAEALYPELARRGEIAVASPVVELDARVVGQEESLHVLGIDLFRAVAIQPALLPRVTDRLDVLRSDAVFLSAPAAQWLKRAAGERVDVQVGSTVVSLRVAGMLGPEVRERLAVMDIAAAQLQFARLGTLSRIDLRVRPGCDIDEVVKGLSRALPPGVAATRPQTSIVAGASLSRAYRVNLDVLALVALFTGSLLVFSTQALAIVRRRPQLALLRVLGLRRRELVALLLAEGALLGLAGSVMGLAAGYGLARLALRVIGADLGSGYFRGVAPQLVADPLSAVILAMLGIAAALAGSALPALEAARAQPAHALKSGDEQRAFARLRPLRSGVVVLFAAGMAMLGPPIADLPLLGYLSIALLLIGALMLLPRLASWAWRVTPTPRPAGIRLSLEQLRAAPAQATVSLASIVASVALMVSMAIMVHSFRNSLQSWLERVLPADLYVRAAPSGDTGFLDPAAQTAITATPGVRRVDFIREQQVLIDPQRPRVVVLARDLDPTDPGRSFALIESSPPAVRSDMSAWVNEAAAALYGWHTGDVVRLPLGGHEEAFAIRGIWRDYARPQGAIVIERARYVALTGDRNATGAAVWAGGGVDLSQLKAALAGSLPGNSQLDIALPEDIRRMSLRAFDRTFAVTYALELAAVVIGLVGLSSAFGALVLARRREFGLLRHLGMLKREIAVMLASEGLLVSGVGMAVGLGLGFLMSLVLVYVVNRQSFHWGMELSVPWIPLVIGTVIV
ncbi:MAG: ABC transporter permease, partial [Pseudomonadota bacterium]|nr:ABC transporter permease [Pseudomonadota bacterium]